MQRRQECRYRTPVGISIHQQEYRYLYVQQMRMPTQLLKCRCGRTNVDTTIAIGIRRPMQQQYECRYSSTTVGISYRYVYACMQQECRYTVCSIRDAEIAIVTGVGDILMTIGMNMLKFGSRRCRYRQTAWERLVIWLYAAADSPQWLRAFSFASR